MVVPPLYIMRDAHLDSKNNLRRTLRKARRDHVGALPGTIRALLFKRPPAPLIDLIPANAVIGLYHSSRDEAPTASYAKFFLEAGHQIALPRISAPDGRMEFHSHSDPFEESDLEPGPRGIMQPSGEADVMTPNVLFVPLVGFTDGGARLGQGGGHYDRWLGSHPGVIAIGLAWDMQLANELPVEPHDMPLSAIITPTRMYGPFDAR